MWEHFEFIYKIFLDSKESEQYNKSYAGFARYLGVSVGKLQKWREEKQWPKTQDLIILHNKLGLSYEWLVTGQGNSFETREDAQYKKETPLASSIPLIGFASCGIAGWYGTMTIPVPVDPPLWHNKMIAVMASGESMLPAGIGHAHICYCDPTKSPSIGEAIYVEQMDGTGAIKLFCGGSVQGGAKMVDLQGWLDKDKESIQIPFTLSISETMIKTIAPVIYVRRRL